MLPCIETRVLCRCCSRSTSPWFNASSSAPPAAPRSQAPHPSPPPPRAPPPSVPPDPPAAAPGLPASSGRAAAAESWRCTAACSGTSCEAVASAGEAASARAPASVRHGAAPAGAPLPGASARATGSAGLRPGLALALPAVPFSPCASSPPASNPQAGPLRVLCDVSHILCMDARAAEPQSGPAPWLPHASPGCLQAGSASASAAARSAMGSGVGSTGTPKASLEGPAQEGLSAPHSAGPSEASAEGLVREAASAARGGTAAARLNRLSMLPRVRTGAALGGGGGGAAGGDAPSAPACAHDAPLGSLSGTRFFPD